MTTVNVVLGIRVVRNEVRRVQIENVDLNRKVSALRERAGQTAQRPVQNLELIYAGIPLEDENTLSSYGFKSGRTIHVLEKLHPAPPVTPKSLKPADLQQFVVAFEEYGHRNVLQKLSRQDVIDKVIASAPELIADPAAIAMLQDPELLLLFSDVAVLTKVLEAHPLLANSLSQIINYLRENPPTANANQATTSTGYSYSLEGISDEEDMDSSSEGQSREGHPLSRNSSYNAITAAQLAAAIANATHFSSTGAVISTPPSQATTTGDGGGGANNIITNEMFGSALEQAFATANTNSSGGSSNTLTQTGGEEENLESLRTRMQAQLQQMRDMGLTNETQNLLALQVTSGNVEAAIELVFNANFEM